ncbi:LytR/AlgR family response regulator transcription factor [Niabella beijingensis]|uniref:LytR/AlgR family response regulator transcription factor n=1 Tax=Niabella beijingensis TaxID=2872700 RepID=UPI001CBC87BD|nr:LytTR family DNA-binding domain-containing protein [Niabella beijingensis]MBZ4189592.1 LytTR family DNA-binding domain-containing protein [Niabella beijingensis]
MNAIAIDDEPIALEVIKTLSAKVPFIKLEGVFTNAFEAIDYLQKNKIDLIFLDIKMPDISGIELSRSLANPPMIIFTTAYTEHAVEGFELNAVDYLLKPFSLVRFIKACTKAQELFSLKNSKTQEVDAVFLKDGYEQVRVMLDEILYIEAAGNYLNVVLKNKKIMTRITINDMMQLLPAERFTRIHRSYIVARDKVTRFNKQSVFIDLLEFPIGNSYQFA